METGKIIFMIVFLVLGIFFGSTIGYNIGKATGKLEATLTLEKQTLDQQMQQVDQTAGAYGNIQTDPLQNVRVNPFD